MVDGKPLPHVDISEFQDGANVDRNDITHGDSTVAIRLGRRKDILLISAFFNRAGRACAKHLFLTLRDGENMQISYRGRTATDELFGFRYGRRHDLFNIAGIRKTDDVFVWDPSAPRTGEARNPNTPVPPSYVSPLECA